MDTVLIILSNILVISFFSSDVYSYEECYGTRSYTAYCSSGYTCCDNNTRCCPESGFTIARIVGLVIGCIFGLVLLCAGIFVIVHYALTGRIPCMGNNRRVTPTQETEVTVVTTEQHTRHGASYDQTLNMPGNEPPPYGQTTTKQTAPGQAPVAQIKHGETSHQ